MPEVTLLSIDHIAKSAIPKIAKTEENTTANSSNSGNLQISYDAINWETIAVPDFDNPLSSSNS